MQAQQSLTLQKPSLATAVAIMATGLAASLALALVVIADRPATLSTPAVVTLHVVGADQVAHNRSEEGLAISSSVGGEQITHNRSEEGLGKAT